MSSIQFVPSGTALVYQEGCPQAPDRLFAVSPDGTHLRRLGHVRPSQFGVPSPDGREVVFSRNTDPACPKNCSAALWLSDRNGAHPRQLTHPGEDTVIDAASSWSPDGRSIVFTRSSPLMMTTLYVVPAAGGPVRSLHVTGQSPVWVNDRIAFVDDDPAGVWTVDPRGTNRLRLAGGKNLWGLVRSVDGSLAYFDVGSVVHVIGSAGRRTAFRVPRRISQLIWSPNGRRLLLSATQGTTPSDLYVVDADGQHFRRLTRDMGNIDGMGWR